MRNKLFFHFYIPDIPSNWELLLYEQLDCIESTQLHHQCKLEICVSSNESNFNKLKKCINYYPVLNLKISWFDTSIEKNKNHFEGTTLSKLHDECCFYENVGYINSISITTITKYTNKWRKALEHAVIEKYQDNLKALNNNYDVSGILWKEPDRWFCGNFWWAKSSYIQTLPKPIIEHWNECNGSFWESRYRYEAWIGIKNPRVNEIYSSNISSLGVSLYYYDFDIKRKSTLKFNNKLSY